MQESALQGSVYSNAGFAESSTRLSEEDVQNPYPGVRDRIRSPRLQRRLGTTGQQVKDEMMKKADGSDSSDDDYDDDDHVPAMAPACNKKSFQLKPSLPTIVEETLSWTFDKNITFSVTIRSNSVHTRKNVKSHKLPEIFDQAKLERRIAEIDEYLDNEGTIQPCYGQRLWEIREAFDDLKAHRNRRDIPESLNTLKFDLEVQVACLAQANVKRFTHLLLHENVSEDMKIKLRRFLSSSETVTNPRLDDNTNLVLDHLKAAAASVESGLTNDPLKTAAEIVAVKQSRLRRDVDELANFLKDILLLRYDRSQYLPRLNIKNLKLLGQYIRWKFTRNQEVAASLARKLGLHPVELDHVMPERLDSLLQNSPVDPRYIQDRLLDLDDIWNWVTGYNRLAHYGRWTELAGQFCDDRAQFDRIFPGELIYRDPSRGIFRSNTKARVRLGMILLRSHFFAKLNGPDDYKLSKLAKSMEKMSTRGKKGTMQEIKGIREQLKALSSNVSPFETEEARPSHKPRALARLTRWAMEAKGSVKTRSRSTYPKESQ
ncbi:MAG: hypothetical protein Q9226_003517 [Calogaya cf. arnoldii]